MPPKKDISGQKFGRLLVIKESGITHKKGVLWLCKCECGSDTYVVTAKLISGHTSSCGCLHMEIRNAGFNKIHGGYGTPEHSCWRSMIERCRNQKHTNRKYWIGVKVCDRWMGVNGFENFLEDMGTRPSLEYSLDRYPNKKGDYEPGNVRWATREQQSKNRSSNVYIEHNGLKMLQSEWAKRIGITHPNLIRAFKNKTFEQVIDNRILKRKHHIEGNFFVMSIN